MGAATPTTTNEERGFTDVTLKIEDNKKIPAHQVILAACNPTFMEDEKKVKKVEFEVKEEKCQLNYILDEFKNMKVAKTNATRPMESKRLDIDELNTRLEMNSAFYLVFKEEIMMLNPGQSLESKGVKIDIESKTN